MGRFVVSNPRKNYRLGQVRRCMEDRVLKGIEPLEQYGEFRIAWSWGVGLVMRNRDRTEATEWQSMPQWMILPSSRPRNSERTSFEFELN